MGPQRILQAACLVGVALGVADAAPTTTTRERVAIIDLGAELDRGELDRGELDRNHHPGVRRQLAAALTAADLEVVIGDGVEDALAGVRSDRDAVRLAAAITEAQRAFGALDCPAAVTASKTAAGIGAARLASGLVVPELPRAWSYLLLCADRVGDVDAAMRAATQLRAIGGSTDVPADVWRKYPEVDAVIDRDLVELEITADATGASIWVDYKLAGTAPVKVLLPVGEHIIAAASGSRSGWAAGTAVRTQTKLTVPTTDQRGPWAAVAERVAGWNGTLPPPAELGLVLDEVRARIAIVRIGDRIEVWGRVGRAEQPHRLGGDDGFGTLAESGRVIALIADRARAYNDRSPDPDRPLLVEDGHDAQGKRRDQPARWWVYASIAGAVAAGAILIFATAAGADRQRVELHQP